MRALQVIPRQIEETGSSRKFLTIMRLISRGRSVNGEETMEEELVSGTE